MIKKIETKNWMDIHNKLTDSKRYIPFMSNHVQSCLRNIPCLARYTCTIVKEENTKLKKLFRDKNIKATKLSCCFNRKLHNKNFTNNFKRSKESLRTRNRRNKTLPPYSQS